MQVTTEPAFIAGCAGPIFCICSKRTVSVNDAERTAVVLIPPFAEEMNRSRRFFTKLRLALLHAGADKVVLPDLYGTGDSAGDFVDATWQIWVRDLCCLATDLRQDGYEQVHVVGVRAGCLLIDEMMHELKNPLARAVYVQPETSGYDVLHHLLRVRVASSRFSGRAADSTDDLWCRLENAQTVAVNGYRISSALAMVFKEKRLNVESRITKTIGNWIEVIDELSILSSGVDDNGSRDAKGNASSKTCNDVDVSSVPRIYPDWRHHWLKAQPFWQLHECEPDDELVLATASCIVPAG